MDRVTICLESMEKNRPGQTTAVREAPTIQTALKLHSASGLSSLCGLVLFNIPLIRLLAEQEVLTHLTQLFLIN